MSNLSDRLARAITDAEQVLRDVEHGPLGEKIPVRRVDLAKRNLDDYVETHPAPANVGAERGGSSSPVELEDREEERRLARQAACDLVRLPAAAKEAERAMLEITRIVNRYVETVDASKLDEVPGCVSCARTGVERGFTIGGHYEQAMPVAHKRDANGKIVVRGSVLASSRQLCRGCFDHALGELREADAPESRIMEFLPPVKWCDLRRRGKPREAGNWWAKEVARREERKRQAGIQRDKARRSA